MAFKMYVDDDGIPYSDYANYRGIEIGRQRSILAVAERGLWYWNEFLRSRFQRPLLLSYDWKRWPENRGGNPKNADEAQAMLIKCADWVQGQIIRGPEFSWWEYPYPFSYSTPAGWKSGHAQAVGCQILSIAASLTGEETFRADIPSLVRAFAVEIDKGGLCVRTRHGNLWFEKIAHPRNDQPRVLNGHLFAVLGLLDVAKRERLSDARALGLSGVAAAKDEIARYDLGHWSAYSIDGKRASAHYHSIHIEQLRRLRWHGGRPLRKHYVQFVRQRDMINL